MALLKSIETSDQPAINYINSNKCIQRNLANEVGITGLKIVRQNQSEGIFKVNVIRVFQDGEITIENLTLTK